MEIIIGIIVGAIIGIGGTLAARQRKCEKGSCKPREEKVL